jgi:hypothetical protein
MSTTSAPAIRHTLRSCASPLRSQKRWAQVHDVRFVATHQDTNKIIDRYKEKLAQKAKEYAFGTIQIEHKLSQQQRRTWLDLISQRSLQGQDPRLPTCCFEDPLYSGSERHYLSIPATPATSSVTSPGSHFLSSSKAREPVRSQRGSRH